MNKIYAYTVVGRAEEEWQRRIGSGSRPGVGLIKVGQTNRTVRARLKEQLGTAFPGLKGVKILLDEPAVRLDGSEFTDYDVHAVLVAQGIKRPGGEWFEADLDEVKAAINVVRTGIGFDARRTEAFGMRPEQADAVEQTAAYFSAGVGNKGPLRFLWNAKMRFGKTFTAYQLARKMGWSKILVLTYKPAVLAAWRDDLLTHVDFEGWKFVDRASPPAFRDEVADGSDPQVWFASFQDLKGRTVDGQIKDHNETIHLLDWDCVILDEYHFGAWRDTARDLYDPVEKPVVVDEDNDEEITSADLGLTTGHILYLSGTPFRAITNGEFTEDQVFNWTYIDEQSAKVTWKDALGPNPYQTLPSMEIYSYDMGDGDAAEYADDGEFNGFSLNELFKARALESGAYSFEREGEVSEFLELLRGKMPDHMKIQVLAKKPPFPYEDPKFKKAVEHTVWYMPDVASCYAMKALLDKHPYFTGFDVVVVAGTKTPMGAAAKPLVEETIDQTRRAERSGSITLSCGKLMTGVTISEWSSIFMLRSLKSPESYFQSAFRVQSPWADRDAEGTIDLHKPTCYVFEFDPNRALDLVAQYGSKLAASSEVTAREALGELLNYLPIYGFTGGRMTELDATGVLDWATAGIGATALAAQWNSPLLVNVTQETLERVLTDADLLERIGKIESFRALVKNGPSVVTESEKIKKAKRESAPKDPETEKKVTSQKKEIREQLQKFLAKIPIFMYVTDFREEAIQHVIESLDSELFERVTGITVETFHELNSLGLFNAQHLEHAVYQFRAFERTSLKYAMEPTE